MEWLYNKDFANYWIAAQLVLGGNLQDAFGPHADYFRHMTAAFGAEYPWHNWSYPPHYLLLIWPLGLFSYVTAMAGFLLVSLWAYLYSARAVLWAGLTYLTPFILSNIYHAQNGFITGALFIAGLSLRDRRPIIAGLCFALLTIKPQLGVMLPILLLFERNWQVIATTVLASTGLVLLSGLCFGWDSWAGYINHVIPYQSEVMTEFRGLFLNMMPSAFGGLRRFSMPTEDALALHLALAGLILIFTCWGLWRLKQPQDRMVLTIMATFVITPYWLVYDFGPVAMALAMMAMRMSSGARLWLYLIALVPLLSMVIPGPWLIVFLVLIVSGWAMAFMPLRDKAA